MELKREIGITLVLPDNNGFLHADFALDPSADLPKAEESQERRIAKNNQTRSTGESHAKNDCVRPVASASRRR